MIQHPTKVTCMTCVIFLFTTSFSFEAIWVFATNRKKIFVLGDSYIKRIRRNDFNNKLQHGNVGKVQKVYIVTLYRP